MNNQYKRVSYNSQKYITKKNNYDQCTNLNYTGQKLFLAENSEILIFATYLVWKGLFFVKKKAYISLALDFNLA